MKHRDEYHTLIDNAIEQLKTVETFGLTLINLANRDDGYLEIAISKEERRMTAWHDIFHSGRPDARYCASTMEEVAATFESLRFDAQYLMTLEQFTLLLGNNFRVKKFADADNQFIGMSDDRLVLFHISDDWEHVHETVGHHVSLVIN